MTRHFWLDDEGRVCHGPRGKGAVETEILSEVTCGNCLRTDRFRLCDRAAAQEPRDEAYEWAAARARANDFADTDGKDWT